MPHKAKNSSPLKFFDPKRVEFREVFGAEESVRLTPTDDDKPKITEIMPFRAGSDYSCLLMPQKKFLNTLPILYYYIIEITSTFLLA